MTLNWLNSTPFNRQAVSVVAPGLRQVEVALIELEVPARTFRPVRQSSGLFEFPPVIPAIVSLDLVTRGRGAPKKAVWEAIGHARRLMGPFAVG
jgi:hypothetical protein